MRVLLFGGTSEGRELARWLDARGCPVTVCVATDYGADLICGGAQVEVLTGRLDQAGMELQMAERRYDCVVDATHPYAVEVSANIAAAAQSCGLPRYRLVRDGDVTGRWLVAEDMNEAARLTRTLPGRVLLTTGSKELDTFAEPELVRRCYPRVLPSVESLKRCLELGFPKANILCMQGPFSKELNVALIEQYDIRVLVTKASGTAGGFWEKEAAARQTGCALVVIGRPVHEAGLTPDELKQVLSGTEAGGTV